jgi:hypothetical protein
MGACGCAGACAAVSFASVCMSEQGRHGGRQPAGGRCGVWGQEGEGRIWVCSACSNVSLASVHEFEWCRHEWGGRHLAVRSVVCEVKEGRGACGCCRCSPPGRVTKHACVLGKGFHVRACGLVWLSCLEEGSGVLLAVAAPQLDLATGRCSSAVKYPTRSNSHHHPWRMLTIASSKP